LHGGIGREFGSGGLKKSARSFGVLFIKSLFTKNNLRFFKDTFELRGVILNKFCGGHFV